MSLDHAAADVLLSIGTFPIPEHVGDMDDAVSAWHTLCEAKRQIGHVVDDFAHVIGSAMDDKYMVAAGMTVERKRKPPRRTNWDHDGLLRLVVDSRVVNDETGEIESTLDVLKKVYPLRGYDARTTALRALNIDVDEFAQTEWSDRYTLREHSA